MRFCYIIYACIDNDTIPYIEPMRTYLPLTTTFRLTSSLLLCHYFKSAQYNFEVPGKLLVILKQPKIEDKSK